MWADEPPALSAAGGRGPDGVLGVPPPGADASAAAVEAAYDELFARHWSAMVRLARLLVDDVASAEDVVQDGFLALYRQRTALLDPDRALAYVRSAVVNRARSVIRRRVVARRHLRVAEPDHGPGADEPLLLADEHREVLAAVDRLPRRQREILVLRFWENLSDAAIADVLGIAEVTVRATASRAAAAVGRELATAAPEGSSDRPRGGRDV